MIVITNKLSFALSKMDSQAVKTDKSFRWTKQKKKILEVLKGTKSHPTAEWVYQAVRKHIPDISLGTVYRNLSLLKDHGYIITVDGLLDYSKRYDADTSEHYHIVCEVCGRVNDLGKSFKINLNEEGFHESGYKVTGYRLIFLGVCPQCLQQDRKESASMGVS